jgi:hypothetical protein
MGAWLSCVGLAAPVSAATLAIGDSNQLGYIDPGTPASTELEAAYINFMTDLASGETDTYDGAKPSQDNEITRTTNVLCGFSGACPDATDTGAFKDSTDPSTTIDLGDGWTYLLAKYDGPNFGSVVWYVAGLDEVTIPETGGGYGLSHYTLFNPGDGGDDDNVDGGDDDNAAAEPTTLLLLGSGLVAASARLRRRRNS